MKRVTTMFRALLLAFSAAIFLLACGEEAPTSLESSEPAAKPAVANAAAEPVPGLDSIQPPKMPPIPGRMPSTVAAELARKIEMPDFYPSDGPVYPNTPPSKVFVNGDRVNLMFGTNDSGAAVVDFMTEEMIRLGWDNADVQRMSNIVSIQATKNSRDLIVVVTEIKAGTPNQTTLIAVSVTAN
jgi:hypothetical protein